MSTQETKDKEIFKFDWIVLNANTYELTGNGVLIEIEPLALELLILLLRNSHRIMSKREIFELLWGKRIVTDYALSTCLKSVRQAIGDDGKVQKYVKTIRGRGYRFVGNLKYN